MQRLFALILVMLAPLALQAAGAERFITKVELPSGQTAVVAEGDFEARSIGSFSVRLYQAASPGDETTFFSMGLVRVRDGAIEEVELTDIDGDRKPEIIVIVRSAGSGGYLSSHAFAYDDNRLTLLNTAEGLPSNADPVEALRISKMKEQ